MNGLDGNDDLHGGRGDDVLDGGTNNDILDGGVGNDTYVFSRGFGQDVISDNDPTQGNIDSVTFGPDITPADVHVTHDTQNVYLTIDGSMDRIKLSNWLTSDAYKIEQVKFSDGTLWNRTTLFAKAMEPGDGGDRLVGDGEDNVFNGLGGDDTLDGQDGNDTLMGGADNDTLDGGTGADTLDGGAGVDTMNGGAGSDTYVFNRGYGRDTLSDWDRSGSDIDGVQFGSDIAPSDVRITRDAYHLYLQVNGTSDRLTLSNYFHSTAYRIDQVKFADGTLWTDLESRITWADPTSNADTVYGSLRNDAIDGLEGNDTLYGDDGNDTLSGGDGADILLGGAGDDTLDGGAGNDALNGGESYYGYGISNGKDTYLFGRGSGQDVIFDYDVTVGNRDTVQMGPDVLPSDVRVTRDYQNLYLSINGTTDRLTLQSWFVDDAHKVEQVRFADETLWDISTLIQKSRISSGLDDTLIGDASDDVINGLGGNDLLDGQGGNDTLDGGAGDDTLMGGSGADTYRFGRGYGQDVITEVDETTAGVVDTVQLGADIAPADVTVTKYGYDLHLNIVATSDRLTLRNWLNGTNYRVEEVRFADGTVWNGATLETLAAQAGIVGTAGNDSLTGTSGDDSIQGAGGNDTVYGYGGRDVLDGGSGNDTLHAASSAGGLDSGEDVYLFGRGSGRDAVYDYDTTAGNTDVIRLAADVLPSDVVVWRGANDLYLSIGAVTGSEDRIAITNWFTNTANRIERIEFADGTVWGTALLTTAPILGTTGNDTIYGTVGDDLFDGKAGNDMLFGYTGGGYDSGEDVYLFGRGSGRDTVYDYDTTTGNTDVIRLAADVLPSDVVVWRGTNDLYLSIGALTGSEDRIAITNWFTNTANRVERVEFADGTVWGEEKLALAPMLGTPGNDNLVGTAGDDLIDGGGGNDTVYGYGGRDVLEGGSGNDTLYAASSAGGLDSDDDVYLFGRGSGRDTVYDYDTTAGNTDVIRLATDVFPSDVVVWRGTNACHHLLSVPAFAEHLMLHTLKAR